MGRTNVGKSTLFNRLVGARKTVTSSTRGTTRDRVYGQTEWNGVVMTLIDTGGFELADRPSRSALRGHLDGGRFAGGEGLSRAIQSQIQQALQDADAFLFVCSVQEGLVPADELILKRLRTAGKPVVLVVNKADHQLVVPPDFFTLGLSDAFPVSALHGHGTGDLLDHLVRRLAPPLQDPAGPGPTRGTASPPLAVAIIGRQNVGKSSYLNALLQEDRVIVSEMPGTTRDAVDTLLRIHGQPVQFIDTAGLRHRRKVKDPVDFFSMSRTRDVLERCDVALVLLDATQGVTRDDHRIVTRVCELGRGLVLLVNKWDLVKGGSAARMTQVVRRAIPYAAFAPVLAVSAKTGFQVPRSVTTLMRVVRTMRQEMTDVDCTKLLRDAWQAHTPPRFAGRVIRLTRARWISGRPVRVELITSPIGCLPVPYQHYLLKRLHQHPRLSGVPLQLVVTGPMPRGVPRRSPRMRRR